MTDIVERLRNFAVWNNRHSHYDPVPVCQEAVAEITRLRAQISASADGKGAEPVAWLYEVFIGDGCWSQKYSDTRIVPEKWIRNIRPLYLAPPSPPAAQMREALRHAQVRFECLADEFEKAGDTASWAMCRVDAGRMFKALSALPKPAVETEEGE